MRNKKLNLLLIVVIIIIILMAIYYNSQIQSVHKESENETPSGDRYKFILLTTYYANNTGETHIKINKSWVGIRLVIYYNTSFIDEGGYVNLIAPPNYIICSLTVMSRKDEPDVNIKLAQLKPFNSDTLPSDVPEESLWKIVWNFKGGPVKISIEKVELRSQSYYISG